MPPAAGLSRHLLELLFAYSLVMRRYNGDPGEDVESAAATALGLSPSLAAPRLDAELLPASAAQALLECIVRASSPPLGVPADRRVDGAASDAS